MSPADGAVSRDANLRSVDLPHPDGPTIATSSPRCTVRLTLSSACVPSGNVLLTCANDNAAAPCSRGRGTSSAGCTPITRRRVLTGSSIRLCAHCPGSGAAHVHPRSVRGPRCDYSATRARSEELPVRVEPEQELPDGLEVCRAPLQLLGDRVHITKAAFERPLGKDRGRAGRLEGRVDDRLGLMRGMGRRKAHVDPLLQLELARLAGLVPRLADGVAQQMSCAVESRPRAGYECLQRRALA